MSSIPLEKLENSIPSTSEDFLIRLLSEQQDCSAVERFSSLHEDLSSDAHEPAQAKYYRRLLPTSNPAAGEQYGFEVDLDACSGCKACVIACHTLNGLDDNESWRKVGTLIIGDPNPEIQYVTAACHHCEDPGCLNGCPVLAYEKDPLTGIVRHLDDQCIGCKYCMMTCPYEVPQFNHRLGIVRKCDMCSNRLRQGEAPACVQACPNGAISIRLTKREASEFSDQERLVPGAPRSTITRPSSRYRTASKSSDGDPIGGETQYVASNVDMPSESHWPLAFMLVATQASVGVLLVHCLLGSLVTFGAWPTDAVWSAIENSGDASEAQLAALIPLLVSLALAMLGLGFAPLHLGQPQRAWRIFLGLRTSWLSREAVVLGIYVALLSLASAWAGIRWLTGSFSSTGAWVVDFLILLAIPAGVFGLICSGMIYVVTRREIWNGWRTLAFFGGTTWVAGTAWAMVGLALVQLPGSDRLTAGLWMGLSATIAASLTKLWSDWRLLVGPKRPNDHPLLARSRNLVHIRLGRLRRFRLVLGGTGALAALGIIAMGAGIPVIFLPALLGIAAVVLSLGELCERLLYFSSVVHDRMPGDLP